MPALGVLLLIIEIVLVVHVLRTGRSYLWIFFILFFPLIGTIVYLVAELLPELRGSPAARRTTASVFKAIDPGRDLRRRAQELELSDNAENKMRLAEECLKSGLHEEAVRLYEGALRGIFKDDPRLLFGLAQAYFGHGQYPRARETLDRLLALKPGPQSGDARLLYAQVLEALGETEAALREYQAVAVYYTGAEAKYRCALLCKRLGRTDEANALFREIVKTAEQSPRFYRRAQRDWISLARKELA